MTETKLFIVLNNIKRNSMIIKVLKLKIFNLFSSLFGFLIQQLMTVFFKMSRFLDTNSPDINI